MTKAEFNHELLAKAVKALEEIARLAREPELNAEAAMRLERIGRHADCATASLQALKLDSDG